MKIRRFQGGDVHLRFLYSQGMSNGKTTAIDFVMSKLFLYSQGMSNGKTCISPVLPDDLFLYSQGMSNGKTTKTSS